MPTCACGSKDLYLLGFELDKDLRTVLVTYRCASCSSVASAVVNGEPGWVEFAMEHWSCANGFCPAVYDDNAQNVTSNWFNIGLSWAP